jgi:hypothetical protein
MIENGNLSTINFTALIKCAWVIPESSPCAQHFQRYRRGRMCTWGENEWSISFEQLRMATYELLYRTPLNKSFQTILRPSVCTHPPQRYSDTAGGMNVYLEVMNGAYLENYQEW